MQNMKSSEKVVSCTCSRKRSHRVRQEKDTVREMRYCPNEPSIWTDEQGDKSVKQSVVFREGRLFV